MHVKWFNSQVTQVLICITIYYSFILGGLILNRKEELHFPHLSQPPINDIAIQNTYRNHLGWTQNPLMRNVRRRQARASKVELLASAKTRWKPTFPLEKWPLCEFPERVWPESTSRTKSDILPSTGARRVIWANETHMTRSYLEVLYKRQRFIR